MEITVKSKYLKISPRKLRLAVNLVRGKNLEQARGVLYLSGIKSSRMVKNLVDSAIAAVKESGSETNKFHINNISCCDGPRLKRGKPASKGSVMPIKKRQSHLFLSVTDKLIDSSYKKTNEIQPVVDNKNINIEPVQTTKIEKKDK